MFSKVSFWIFIVIAIILGLAIGLYIGWIGWPVEWVDASPEHLRVEYQADWMNMAIDSYAVNQSAELAAQRYNALGESAQPILEGILADPLWVSADNADAFAQALTTQTDIAVPYPPSAAPSAGQAAQTNQTKSTFVMVILLLALLAIVLLAILVIRLTRRREEAAIEPAPVDEGIAGEAMPEAPMAEPEAMPEGEDVLRAAMVEEAPAIEGEVAPVEEEGDDGGRAALAAAAAAGLAAVATRSEGEEEPVEAAVEEEGAGIGEAAVVASAATDADDVGWALEEPLEEPLPESLEEPLAEAAEAEPVEMAEGGESLAAGELPADYYGKYNRKIIDVEGIGPAYSQRLEDAGIPTAHAYLQQCATPKGRQELAAKTGISGKLILDWANHIDMMRVSGIGPQWSDLLEKAGVNTVRELALRNPQNLLAKMEEANTEKNLVRQMPRLDQLEDWIEQAKDLPRILTY